MRHLSMKLHRVNRTGAMPKPGERVATVRRSDVTRRHLFDMVTVAHPRGRTLAGVEAREQPRRLVDRDLRTAILTPTATDDRTTFQMRDQLHAVAHTEHRGKVEQGAGDRGCTDVRHRARPPGQNDAIWLPGPDPVE